jgi:hypothetical protein
MKIEDRRPASGRSVMAIRRRLNQHIARELEGNTPPTLRQTVNAIFRFLCLADCRQSPGYNANWQGGDAIGEVEVDWKIRDCLFGKLKRSSRK